MKKKSIIKVSLLGIFLISSFNGCGQKLAVNRDVGQLNLQYQVKEQNSKVNKKIAIISPEFNLKKDEDNLRLKREPIPVNTNSIRGISSSRFNVQVQLNFNDLFEDRYSGRISKALNSAFEDLILKKGFTIGGKYETFDDMTYPDRKSTYMALLPILNLNIDKKITSSEMHRLNYSEKGEIQVSGEFIIKMIEPLSKQMFITKRINLSNFNIIKPYIYEIQTTESNADGIGISSLVSSAMDKVSAPAGLRDSTDKALTEAINEFFIKSMEKIEKYLSQEEILSVEKDIQGAKGKTGGSW